MNKKFALTVFLAGINIAFCHENTFASECKAGAITATTKITGTIYNSASSRAIFRAAMNQNLEKWTKAAIRKKAYARASGGPKFSGNSAENRVEQTINITHLEGLSCLSFRAP